MSTRTSELMRRTHQPVRRWVTRERHYDHVWASYINDLPKVINVSSSKISRNMRGVTLPPWSVVVYYAEKGTRCPKQLEDDLHEYIWLHYRSRAAEEGLRAALMKTLTELPKEDAEDICAYWREDDLANMWAVLQWYALCCDYANRYW